MDEIIRNLEPIMLGFIVIAGIALTVVTIMAVRMEQAAQDALRGKDF